MAVNKIGCTIVTVGNLQEIAEKLERRQGKILIAEPGPQSWEKETIDVSMLLFAHPLIIESHSVPFLTTPRPTIKLNGADFQIGWQNDRQYLLRPVPKRSRDPLFGMCRDLLKSLDLGNYEFLIEFQPASGMDLFSKNREVIYFHCNEDPKAALLHGLKNVINRMRDGEPRASLLVAAERIADYADEDLKTGKIFRHNVSCMQADLILGM